jgi:hypothetical protein
MEILHKSFVDLCLRPSANASFVPHHLLHSWYVAYCKEHGYTPLGMSKFISHLKTVLPRNFADRGWSPMVNGQRSKVAAHWEYLVPVEGAFVKSDVEFSRKHFALPLQPKPCMDLYQIPVRGRRVDGVRGFLESPPTT